MLTNIQIKHQLYKKERTSIVDIIELERFCVELESTEM